MSLKSTFPFPLLPPNTPTKRPQSSPTEIRFSRWNNLNAQPFLRRENQQKQISDKIRLHHKFQSLTKISNPKSPPNSPPNSPPPPNYKSPGTPSPPSPPSIPAKNSKYSKPQTPPHPAFRRKPRAPRTPGGGAGVVVSEKGVAYRMADAPFEFQYSYTETPKARPLALREPPFVPFGPATMPRPWTGRAPIPASKKKLPEFDSFRLPPAGKKGVKTVQAPGPFLAGSGPKYAARSREEIVGEPLVKEEVKELVNGCLRSKRQLNMG